MSIREIEPRESRDIFVWKTYTTSLLVNTGELPDEEKVGLTNLLSPLVAEGFM